MSHTKIIDVHTHVFQEAIRKRAVATVGEYYQLKMHGEGSIQDLIHQGEQIGIAKYVIHTVATKPIQVKTINAYISSLQQSDDRLIGFGSVHPLMADARDEIDRIISLGLHGLKLHPEFQNFKIDDAVMMPIYAAIEGRLPMLIHMGDANVTSSSPARLAKILKQFPKLAVIASHLGGYSMWDQSMEHLVGKNVYFDTSSSLAFLAPKKAANIIRAHGTDKVLFGSDYPMWLPGDELKRFLALDLSDDENEKILYGNAAKLFGVE